MSGPLRYLRSTETLAQINPECSAFAQAAYNLCSVQSWDWQTVQPVTKGALQFGQKGIYQPFKGEFLLGEIRWNITLSALTGGTRDPSHHLAWKRNVGQHMLARVAYRFGNESVESYPGTWVYLQQHCYMDADKRQIEEVFDYDLVTRNNLSASPVNLSIGLRGCNERALGVHWPMHAVRTSFRVEIETRPLAECVESNIADLVPVGEITTHELFCEEVHIPPSELKTYVEQPWRVPLKSVNSIQNQEFSAATSVDIQIPFKGVAEGFWIGVRRATVEGSGSGGANESLKMYRLPGGPNNATLSLIINSQTIFDPQDVNNFQRQTQCKYLPREAKESEDYNWLYVPVSLDSSRMAALGVFDLNTPSRVVFRLTFNNAGPLTGDVSLYAATRNNLGFQNGTVYADYS